MSFSRVLSRAWQEDVTGADIEFGVSLYPLYHDRIAELAGMHDIGVAQACGAFAALSPRSKIEANFRSLLTCMLAVRAGVPEERVTVSTYNRGKRAALSILRGDAEFADLCTGSKITAFRHNLLFPHTSERVTIDGHMIGLMLGRSKLTMDAALWAGRDEGKRRGGRRSDAADYTMFERGFLRWHRKHAEVKVLPPSAVQAILWHAKRRLQAGELALGHGVPEAREVKPYPFKPSS